MASAPGKWGEVKWERGKGSVFLKPKEPGKKAWPRWPAHLYIGRHGATSLATARFKAGLNGAGSGHPVAHVSP